MHILSLRGLPGLSKSLVTGLEGSTSTRRPAQLLWLLADPRLGFPGNPPSLGWATNTAAAAAAHLTWPRMAQGHTGRPGPNAPPRAPGTRPEVPLPPPGRPQGAGRPSSPAGSALRYTGQRRCDSGTPKPAEGRSSEAPRSSSSAVYTARGGGGGGVPGSGLPATDAWEAAARPISRRGRRRPGHRARREADGVPKGPAAGPPRPASARSFPSP